MGDTTLGTLAQGSSTSSEDLGVLIQHLIAAVEPLEGKFNGNGRAAFDAFKAQSDEITAALNSALGSIIGGQSGMDAAFYTGDTEFGDNAGRSASAANFDAARFAGR